MHLDLFKIIFLSLYLSIRLFQDDLIKHPKIAFLTLPSHTFRAVTRKRLGEFFFFLHFFRVYTFFFNICHFEHRFNVKRWKYRSTLTHSCHCHPSIFSIAHLYKPAIFENTVLPNFRGSKMEGSVIWCHSWQSCWPSSLVYKYTAGRSRN